MFFLQSISFICTVYQVHLSRLVYSYSIPFCYYFIILGMTPRVIPINNKRPEWRNKTTLTIRQLYMVECTRYHITKYMKTCVCIRVLVLLYTASTTSWPEIVTCCSRIVILVTILFLFFFGFGLLTKSLKMYVKYTSQPWVQPDNERNDPVKVDVTIRGRKRNFGFNLTFHKFKMSPKSFVIYSLSVCLSEVWRVLR